MKSTTSAADLDKRIKEAIDSIRPYLEADGGDVRIVGVNKEKVLEIELLGSCGTCPMLPMTLTAGVEEAVKRVAPEINAVIVVNIPEKEISG